MSKEKYYTIELSFLEKYSAKVVVKAGSDRQARELAEQEFRKGEALYNETTATPDDTVLKMRFVAPGARRRPHPSHEGLQLIPEDDTPNLFKENRHV